MKKILSLFVALVALVTLSACNGKYVADGKFTAFSTSLSSGRAQITWVSVNVEKGKITSFEIDERQSTITVDTTTDPEKPTYSFAWNAKTKKELLYDYGMVPASPIGKEWFEQAKVLEDFFLANLDDFESKVTYDETGHLTSLAGCTIQTKTYVELARQAVQNAEKGLVTAFSVSINAGAPQVTWVSTQIDKKGNVTSFNIDERQSKITLSGATATQTWNAKTKKELLYDYGMVPASPIGKEWFEQAKVLEDFFLANITDFQSKVTYDATGHLTSLAGCTIQTKAYVELALECLELA